MLEIDEDAAEVVQRIFAEYLNGKGDRAIATGLNKEGFPCPSARLPRQNRHRIADGWQASTVRAILENPRYTGYAFFGRWTRQETLLNPDDVAAGNVTRFRRAEPDRIVRSRHPAHPAIISVEEFTQAQLLRRSKAAGGLRSARKAERSGRPTKHTYLFRGRVRCAVCRRKMEASPRTHAMYYRCPARTLAPGSPALADHPPAVYLRENVLRDEVNSWLAGLFHRDNVDQTVQALAASQAESTAPNAGEAAKKRHTDAEARLRLLQEAIEAGVDPAALVESINEAQAERKAAEAELDAVPTTNIITEAEIHARIDSLGDMGEALNGAKPDKLAELYTAVGLQAQYKPTAHEVDVSIVPMGRVNSACVGGGT